MRRKLLYLLIFLIAAGSAFSQKEHYNWYFGWGCAMTFNTPDLEPMALKGGELFTLESCASISDSDGKLLFYTDGDTVWNRNNTPMANGTGLWGSSTTTQGTTIIKLPGSDSLYYVFSLDDFEYWGMVIPDSGLTYSIVDMSLNNGNGGVIKKNIRITDSLAEKMIAVRHGNGKDFWLIVHKMHTNRFLSYLITDKGIDIDNPVVSETGAVYGMKNGRMFTRHVGQMKASPDGRHIASVLLGSWTEYYSFNNLTGKLEFIKNIDLNTYGIEFSPDSKKLYGFKIVVSKILDLYQYNFEDNSMTKIYDSIKTEGEFGQMQLAPNGKIYLSQGNKFYLSVIKNPNEKGTNCNFRLVDIDLVGKMSSLGLPNYTQEHFPVKVKLAGDMEVCAGDSLRVVPDIDSPRPEETVEWTGPGGFTSTDRELFIGNATESASGKYVVTVRVPGYSDKDSLYITVHPSPEASIIAGGPLIFCEGDSVVLKAGDIQPGFSYKWSNGSADTTVTIKKAGNYKLFVESDYGCRDTADVDIYVNANLDVQIEGGTEFCEGDSLTLSAEPKGAGLKYEWSTGETTPDITVTEAGDYKVTVENESGCAGEKTISVSMNPKPVFTIAGETKFCAGESGTLSCDGDFPEYKWSTGEDTKEINIDKPGTYSLTVTNDKGCSRSDSVVVTYYPEAEVHITGETTFCEGGSAVLGTDREMATYNWSTGETSREIEVTTPGKYYLSSTDENGCMAQDSVIVSKMNINARLEPADEINFGYLKLNSTNTNDVGIRNLSNEKIEVACKLQKGENFTLQGSPLTDEINFGEVKNLSINFTPDNIIDYRDTLVVNVTQPCSMEMKLPLYGSGLAKMLVSVPDTTAKVGQSDFCIPIKARIISDKPLSSTSDYTAVIKMEGVPMIPDDGNGSANMSVVEAKDVTVSNEESVIGSFCGEILLGMQDISPLDIGLQWEDPHIEVDTLDGSLTLEGVCRLKIRHVKLFRPGVLALMNNPAGSTIELEAECPVDSRYSLEILSVQGCSVFNESFTGRQGETKHFEIPTGNIPNGVYGIVLRYQDRIYTERVIVVK